MSRETVGRKAREKEKEVMEAKDLRKIEELRRMAWARKGLVRTLDLKNAGDTKDNARRAARSGTSRRNDVGS